MPGIGAGSESHRDIPLVRIEQMQHQGLSNNQIIQTLQRDGYTTTQVFDALNQANMQPTHAMGDMTMPANQGVPPSRVGVPPPGAGVPPPGLGMPPPSGAPGVTGSSNEELIEAIIDEKWRELEGSVNKIIEWKEMMTGKFDKMEQRIEDLKASYDKLHEAVVGKVGEYDQHILQVGAEVKAMEKVFSKVLPAFTENVAELSRITDNVKGRKK